MSNPTHSNTVVLYTIALAMAAYKAEMKDCCTERENALSTEAEIVRVMEDINDEIIRLLETAMEGTDIDKDACLATAKENVSGAEGIKTDIE